MVSAAVPVDSLAEVFRLAEVAAVGVDLLGEVAAAGEALGEGCSKEEWGRKASKRYWKVGTVEGVPMEEVEEMVEMVWMVVGVGLMMGVREDVVRRLCR